MELKEAQKKLTEIADTLISQGYIPLTNNTVFSNIDNIKTLIKNYLPDLQKTLKEGNLDEKKQAQLTSIESTFTEILNN